MSNAMINILRAFIVVCILLVYSIGQAEEWKNNEWEYYSNYTSKQLTIYEFNILIKHIEEKMIALRKAFSKISIYDANFSYSKGKILEATLEATKDIIETAFEYLAEIKTDPNSMSASLEFYFYLDAIISSGYRFSEIDEFEKLGNETHILYLWLE